MIRKVLECNLKENIENGGESKLRGWKKVKGEREMKARRNERSGVNDRV